jgi:flagellar motility protein MotE (MotC chaperone)
MDTLQSTSTLDRVRRLRDNALDLNIALDDLDRELAPLLAHRGDLAAMVHDAEAELAALVARMPARTAA